MNVQSTGIYCFYVKYTLKLLFISTLILKLSQFPQIFLSVHLVHVKTAEHAMKEATLILVCARPASREQIVEQVSDTLKSHE